MFGHQDNTDNNGYQDEHYQQEVDHHIQEFNDSDTNVASAPPANDNQQTDTDLPMVADPHTTQPYHDDSSSHSINLPDEPSGQATDLVDLKTKALDELYPIIHKLDLSAEDNFKTLMMMIQATDNKDLIGQAYEAAEKIEDEGNRAKALLDIVNEINYFTNHPSIDQ